MNRKRTRATSKQEAQPIGLTEERFRANQFELVSRLADDLAHEIKNPLNAIVINLEVLRARVRKGSSDAALDRIDVIEAEVRRLHELVERMLQLLRPGRDDGGTLALDHVLDELIPLVEAQTRLARNDFVARVQASVFVPVRGDALKFALLNIFAAVQDRLGEGGGTLSLECESNASEVMLRIRGERRAVVRNDPDTDSVAGAAEFAGALLAGYGGRVARDGAGVTVLLPRVAVP